MAEQCCATCGKRFDAKRARYCSGSCRMRASRDGKTGVVSAPVVESAGDLVSAVRAELEAAGRDGSSIGVQAVEVARQMQGCESPSGFAALSKELRSVMVAALSNAVVAADPLDELRLRRNAKRTAAG